MSVQSLLRVMVLRDAEAIILESGKVPSLRRKGNVEGLAMPPIDGKLLAEFAEPLLAARQSSDWPASLPFVDGGVAFQVTIEKTSLGYRIVARKGKPAAPPAPAPAPPAPAAIDAAKPTAWWAGRRGGTVTAPAAPGPASDHGAAGHAGAGDAMAAGWAPAGDASARPSGDPSALARLLDPLVALAAQRGASDVILSTGQSPRIRANGYVETLDAELDDDELLAAVTAVGNNADLSLQLGASRVRVNAFMHLAGAAVAARLIRETVPSLADLDLPPELAATIDHRDGLVLVCGPTGSGKSSTLAALIDLLDQRRAAHVITLEDPIEYRFQPRRCLVHQREVGVHVPSFAAGLKSALREAPDVILLGELRDRETIAAALTAAETGHLVLATLHAPNAAGAIDRMIDAFPDQQQRQVRWQLAAVLRHVVTQYLLPRRDGGRAVAVELVPVTQAVANIMRKGDLHTLPTAIQSGREAGMIPLERALARLVESGAVSAQVIKKVAADHDLLGAMAPSFSAKMSGKLT